MSKRAKLLEAIRNNPRGVRFDELVSLVEALGLVAGRRAGSHQIFVHPNLSIPFINLQEGRNGQAKPYQVGQVLDLIDRHKLEV